MRQIAMASAPSSTSPPDRAPRVVARERAHHLARRVHPLVHHHPQVAFHERRRLLPREVVEPRHPQLRSSSTSRKPLLAISPTRAPASWRIAFDATVVPVHDLGNGVRRHPPARRTPNSSPLDDGHRVVLDARRDLLEMTFPSSSSSTMSVNVPPMSTPMRQPFTPRLPGSDRLSADRCRRENGDAAVSRRRRGGGFGRRETTR